MTLLRASLLPLALLVPALMALACALYVRRRRRVAAALGERHLVRRLTSRDLHAIPWRRVAPMLLAALALGLAAADPRWGSAEEVMHTAGRDVVLVLDASNSMLVEDVRPSRLAQQRAAAHRLARALEHDRLGVVVFAGRASVLAPPTRDLRAVEMYIDAIEPGIAPQTGTAIGAGIRQATSLLAAAPERGGGRLVVLISDGEPLDPEEEQPAALVAARRAAGLGVVIHTLGVGTPEGGPVPQVDPQTGRREGYKTDPFTGQTAISRLDEEMLRLIASETRGSYHHLADAGALEALLARLGAAEAPARAAGGGSTGGARAPRYAWFVGLALLLLAADAVAERRAHPAPRQA